MAIIIIIIITKTIKRSQQSIYIYSLYVQYNVNILLGHNITNNDVNSQQNAAYDVIGQFRMDMLLNIKCEDVKAPANRAPDYVNVRNNNERM